jgi:hypothetical protein
MVGTVTTKPFVFGGTALSVNACVRPVVGSLKIVVIDPTSELILASSDSITNGSDSGALQVHWAQKTEVGGAVFGKMVRLRFEMRHTELYSFDIV